MTTALQNLRALIYVAVGGTEGAKLGYRLTVSANRNPSSPDEWFGRPVKGSGYSIGMMQFDFGRRDADSQYWISTYLPGHPDTLVKVPASVAPYARLKGPRLKQVKAG